MRKRYLTDFRFSTGKRIISDLSDSNNVISTRNESSHSRQILVLVRLFVDLTAVNILVLWVWLLQVAWVRLVLVVLGRG